MAHDDSYEWYKAHGICTACHQREAEPHRTLCSECLEKKKLYAKHRYMNDERIRKRQASNSKKRRAKLKRESRCIICGKPIYKNSAYCYEHWIYMKRKNKERYTTKRKGCDGNERKRQ